MGNPFSPRVLAKAADEAAEYVYVTSEDFEGTGVYDVKTTQLKLIENKDGEFWRAIVELECVAHQNPEMVGKQASFVRDPNNKFHNKEILGLIGAIKKMRPQAVTELVRDIFPLDEGDNPIIQTNLGRVGLSIVGREGKPKADGTVPVYFNPEFFAVDEDGNRIRRVDLG